MDDKKQKEEFLKEIFPNVNPTQIKEYLKQGFDINEIISILSSEPLKIELTPQEYLLNIKRPFQSVKSEQKKFFVFNFPELWNGSNVNTKIDIEKFREDANNLLKNANEIGKKIDCKNLSSEYYFEEAEKFRLKANTLNRKACLAILKKMINSNPSQIVDLHGLYVKEALDFMSDYVNICGDKFTVVTGSQGSSQRIRPKILEFLRLKKFVVIEEGPVLRVLGKEKH